MDWTECSTSYMVICGIKHFGFALLWLALFWGVLFPIATTRYRGFWDFLKHRADSYTLRLVFWGFVCLSLALAIGSHLFSDYLKLGF
jgi:hypothetical protein